MCSLGDENFETSAEKYLPKKETNNLSEVKCNKCRENNPCIVLRNKDAYCKSCFLTGTTHKFKSLLGKHRMIRPNDQVLILHKIGHASAALLQFLREGLDLTTPKKLRFQPVILFVEDLFNLPVKERQEALDKVKIQVEAFKFKLHLISFASYLLNNDEIENLISDDSLAIKDEDKDSLHKVIDKKASKTSKNDIIHTLKRKLLIDVAKHLNCKFIFTPELSMDVASQLLTNISLGRGSHVPIDTGFCDDRDPDVKILRPLRLFDTKELAFYNFLNNLQPVFIKQRHENPYSSVQDLMNKFVSELQCNYPATVTTVLKTGDKLALEKSTNNEKKCQLCKAVLVVEVSQLSSAESTSFSHWVSTQTPDYLISPQERYEKTLETFGNIKLNNYCYSCAKVSNYIRTT